MKCVKEGYKVTELGEIPNDWRVKSIGEIFEFSGGLSISRAKLTDKGVNYLHYGDIHMRNENYIDTEKDEAWLPKIEDKFEEIKENVKLNSGDVVFADASEDYEGIGKSVAIFNDSEKPFVAGLHTIVAKDINNQLDKNYKRYCFSTNEVRKQFRYLAVGTSVYGISRENIKKIKINIPTIKEQQKIASILSTVDEQIDNVDALIEKNKELKKGLMQTLFTKGIGHTKFKKTEIGEIPEGWSIKTINDVVNLIKSGLSRSLKDEDIGIPCIRSNNMNNYKFDKSDLKYWFLEDNKGANINEYILRDGDILVNFINSLAQIGKTCLYEDIGRPVIYTTNIFRMNLNEQIILNKYFYYISQTERYNNEIKLITKPAVNQASFTVADFKSIKISIPPINEQMGIVSILSEVDKKIEEHENKKQKLEEIKKGLMQQLLTGKIRVL